MTHDRLSEENETAGALADFNDLIDYDQASSKVRPFPANKKECNSTDHQKIALKCGKSKYHEFVTCYLKKVHASQVRRSMRHSFFKKRNFACSVALLQWQKKKFLHRWNY